VSSSGLSDGTGSQNYWPRVHTWDRCIPLSGGTVYIRAPGNRWFGHRLDSEPAYNPSFTASSESSLLRCAYGITAVA
jgi:hypothetical protein